MDIESEANLEETPGSSVMDELLATTGDAIATDPSYDSLQTQKDDVVSTSSGSFKPDELLQAIDDVEMIETPTEESTTAQDSEPKLGDGVQKSETVEDSEDVTPMEVSEESIDKIEEASEEVKKVTEEPPKEAEKTAEESTEFEKTAEESTEEAEKTAEESTEVKKTAEESTEVEKTAEESTEEVGKTSEKSPKEVEKLDADNDGSSQTEPDEESEANPQPKVDSDPQTEPEKDVNHEKDSENAEKTAALSDDASQGETENNSQAETEESAQPESETVAGSDGASKEPADGSQKEQSAKDPEKDKGDAANNIEYVEMDETMETEDNGSSEFVSVNLEKDDGENKEHEEQNNTDTLGNVANSEDDPMFVGVTSDKDDHDKEDNDKESGNKDDLMDEDPIAADDHQPIDDNENQEGADEELCIIPDTERVLSQEEKDAAAAMTPLKDISEAAAVAATDHSCAALGIGTSTQPNEDTSVNADKFVVSKCNTEELQTCIQCVLQRKVKYTISKQDNAQYICSDTCLDSFKESNTNKYILNWEAEIRVKDFSTNMSVSPQTKVAFERKCVVCKKKTDDEEQNLTWEIMDFCNEFCLTKYQKEIGSICANCFTDVRPNSLGKYCVRFGNDIRQFCTSHCLEEYKKGLKVCSYCQQDMSKGTDGGFLAPVGDKGQFKDFCSQQCMEKYDIMTNNRPPKAPEGSKCSVCKQENQLTIEYESDGVPNYFCNERCFVAFTFVNNIQPSKCSLCRRYYPNEVLEKNTMFYDNVQYSFCSNSCQNIYIIAHRKIVPCVWCKVKKYNFDMIRRYFKTGPVLNMCSINCLSLFQVSVNAVHSKKTVCNFCNKRHQPMYHLTMSDATIRNFCSYMCVMSFQNKFKKSPITLNNEEYPVPAGEPKKSRKFNDPPALPMTKPTSPTLPVISNVQSLAQSKNGGYAPVPAQNSTPRATRGAKAAPAPPQHVVNSTTVETQVQIKHHIIIKPPKMPEVKNAFTSCRVKTHNKATTMKPIMHDKGIQTDEREAQKVLVPVPVPIYIPSPLPMYTTPVPYPLPFPIPIPIPIFIPTTRNSAKGIMKEIKKIQVKIPTDPYEAELLMMAEMVAGDKKEENVTDSESDVDDAGAPDDGGSFSPEPVDASNTFGDDMLQMALKMATELEEPAVDLEGALTANTITAPQGSEPAAEEAVDDPQPMMSIGERQPYKGRKRGGRGGKQSTPKRRRLSQPVDMPVMPPQPVPPPEPAEKPDAHLCLKYTFGVNAWKQWVTTKNSELEKSTKFSKPFKTEILQLTADELNYSLCLFVKEVRKPNGAEYAPDTIYYLCLGIQQYLFENGRIDNIFCDPYYEQFTDSLDEVARKFSVLYNDSHYIVTRVEEEHLWESKQLGAHSPHVLLSTLMFFNTKHFNLTTVQEHMQLSFSHIMKHWKRNPNQAGVARTPGSRNVLLRFYPPQTANQNNTRKKKVYEQQENDENPLRCPVKLYEFYLSKCPESVKTRNDVFYLQPERSCVPDSPVWYSTTALAQENLEKMLHRVKMVKEINVALLTS